MHRSLSTLATIALAPVVACAGGSATSAVATAPAPATAARTARGSEPNVEFEMMTWPEVK